MNFTAALGWISTVLFTVCYIPQIVKTVQSKTVDGLSFSLLVLQGIGNVVALWYATRIAQPPLQIKYILALCFLLVCIVLYMQTAKFCNRKIYEHRDHRSSPHVLDAFAGEDTQGG